MTCPQYKSIFEELPTEICPDCQGSGEGAHEDTICRQCQGRGVIRLREDPFDAPADED